MKIIRLVELIEEGITNHDLVFGVLGERNIIPTAHENGNVQVYDSNSESFEKMYGVVFGKEISDNGGQMMFVHEKKGRYRNTFDMYRCDIIGNI
ncbi:hypothetical protein HOG16_03820 [Candidatus Woesearchaeota archaeon]|jgi:hypothetical protein|nr:hypothetical protein [Candidatus Woesearchaeota archaeon]MBT4321893.1 hypothetical protein [Candidatus Woesearchaeota archaeon]